MDKSWIEIRERTSDAFLSGLESFLDFAFLNKPVDSKIKCPCRNCRNSRIHVRKVVHEHVIFKGFLRGYTNWVHQGEQPHYLQQHADDILDEENEHEDVEGLIHDAYVSSFPSSEDHESAEIPGDEARATESDFDINTEKFFNLLKLAEVELFPGCKNFTFLSFIMRLLHVKSLCRWTNNSFTMLMEVLKEAFQHIGMFPNSHREAWNLIKDLGLDYKKIHACPNDCMLYWKETEKDEECRNCKTSRYKNFEDENEGGSKKKSKIPAKVVRYFPLKPRLQRLFMSSKTAPLMRWHAEKRINDGKLRHPADSQAWRLFDEKFPDFATDFRHVRLGLAADGFSPFRSMNISHSTWPIVLIPYNLPPGKCMKQSSIILSTLIDGPKSPGNNIDVYLQPLIDELKEFWYTGVRTYDAVTKSMFTLRASLLWTINDFPAYAMLSGWSTKGAYACPPCNKNGKGRWLKHGRKHCYMWSRRFLTDDHTYRKDKIHFDGSIEKDPKPKRLSGSEILEQLDGMVTKFGKYVAPKVGRKRKQIDSNNTPNVNRYNWKKISIFFQLPYWKENLVPHNLDIMHIEKNVMENILWTLLGVTGKTKDNIESRRDLQDLGIRKPLHPRPNGGPLPPASTTLSKREKDIFLNVLKSVKVPDGYSSNISNCVNLETRQIHGLKSHDCHILMQQLLPIALRRSVPKHVCKAIIGLCDVFKQLYSKVHAVADFEALELKVALVLCELEKIFPPSFFDVMEHLPIHLPEEAKLAGPVQPRSMYPIERYLCTLKNYVRTRSHPEGSIAEGYLAEECMTFCSMYLSDVETKLNRPGRNNEADGNFPVEGGRPLGKHESVLLDNIKWIQAHTYVLNNLEIVDSFKSKHLKEIKHKNRLISDYDLQKTHAESFHEWFKSHVSEMVNSKHGKTVEPEIRQLAAGPSKWVRRYTGYVINGLRFHTKQREIRRKTQNSGVFTYSLTRSFSSTKDKNPITGDVPFYGILQDIIELRYTNDIKFVLFKCDWVDNNSGLRCDEFNFTLVNFNHLRDVRGRIIDEPFILASQVEQAWFIQDPVDTDWHVALKMTPRGLFNVEPEVNEIEEGEDEQFLSQEKETRSDSNDKFDSWVRTDSEGIIVEHPTGETYVDDQNLDDANSEDEDDDEDDGRDYFFSTDDSSDDDDFFDKITDDESD